MQYKFVVKDAAEADIPRILSEAPANQDALLIAVMGDAAALLLRKEFVSQFVKVDHIVVGSESLSSEWGVVSYFCVGRGEVKNALR
jgi:hypothetical protein